MTNQIRELGLNELESVGGGRHEMYMAAIKHLACNHATDHAMVGQEQKAPARPSLALN